MFQNMTLKMKLMISFLVVGIVPFFIISIYSYINIDTALRTSIDNQYVGIAMTKQEEVQLLFQKREEHLNLLVQTIGTLKKAGFTNMQAIHSNKKTEIEFYYKRILDEITAVSYNRLVATALNKISETFQTEKRTGGEKWTAAVSVYSSSFEQYQKSLGQYNDLLLVDKDGNVVYNLSRNSSLGQNVVTGELKNTPLGECFDKIMKNPSKAQITDIALYAPDNNDPTHFAGIAVKSGSEIIGAYIMELNIDKLFTLMEERKGLGKEGELFMVGQDYLMRSNIYLDPQNRSVRASLKGKDVQKNGVRTPATEAGLAGKTGIVVLTDYAGNHRIAAYAPVVLGDVRWCLILKLDLEEVICPQTEENEEFLAQYRETYGYRDLLLINADGFCFYTVAKESDYKANFFEGKFKNSSLANALQKCKRNKQMAFADYEPYAPSNNKPSGFIVAPVVSKGQIDMFVALKMETRRLNALTHARYGMGKTGEIYLVGPDRLMRSDSYLDPTNHSVEAAFANPEKSKIDTVPVKNALEGKSGVGIHNDYRGQPVVSAYAPVKIFDATWALVAELDVDEAFAAVSRLTWVVAVLFILGAIAIVSFAVFLANSVSVPITRIVAQLSAASDQVASASNQMSKSNQEISEGASEQASTLEEVSSSMEEMSAMTKQNADNANEAEKLSKSAKKSSEDGHVHMNTLSESMIAIGTSAQEMQKIIKNIEEIAFQTNMLALNAAVEAARAGEHGRGFAVVADEVRNLARKSAEFAKSTSALVVQTTDDIKESSEKTKKTMEVFTEILAHVTKVSELSAEVAAATQEQARGLNQVTVSVTDMDKVVQENAANSEEGASVSEELNSQAIALQNMVHALLSLVEGQQHKDTVKNVDKKTAKTAKEKVAPMAPATPAAPAKMANVAKMGNLEGRKVQKEKFPVKPEQVIPLNEEEFKDF